MKHRLLAAILGLITLVAVPIAASIPAQAQTPPDYDLPSGARFYTQTDGQAGATGTGFAVSNAEGIPFLEFMREAGGVPAVGYPVSHRFRWNGFTVQAFQKVVFQWRPEARTVYYVNVLDELGERGFNSYLQTVRQVPPPADWSGDTGLPFAQVAARHLALLDTNPAIAAAYRAEPDSLNRNGLPMAPIQNMGNVNVLRAQRKVFQQWLIDVPWARAGQVVTANGGDLGKEAGLYPAAAVRPQSAANVPLGSVGELGGPQSGGPTATPVPAGTAPPGVCNGDESMTFDPDPPSPGRAFTIYVTSARPSTNVSLTGTGNPRFLGTAAGGKGTLWAWTVTPTIPGRHDYEFRVGTVVCTSNFIEVVGTPVPASSPTISPGACQGDEAMTFEPDPPTVGRAFTIRVTSVKPSANVSLGGPGNPSFSGTSAGGKGTIWSWTATVTAPGRHDYEFKVGNAVCTSNFIEVEGTPIPATATPVPSPTISSGPCQGDETMTFEPGRPGVNQLITILVTSARPSTNVALSGPGNPQMTGTRAGGAGTIWTWTVTHSQAGRYDYNFMVAGNVCTSNFIQVG